jgi:hypothetical protein
VKKGEKRSRAGGYSKRPISAAAALSFLKDTRGDLTWKAGDLAETLHLSASDAAQVLEFLQLQGYVTPSGGEWVTTTDGESVSGSKAPRFSRARVQQALQELAGRMREANRDKNASHSVTAAVAFGDFLRDRPRVQAADVGVVLDRAHDAKYDRGTGKVTNSSQERAFLRRLKAGSPMLNLRPYEEWMSLRTHRKLI